MTEVLRRHNQPIKTEAELWQGTVGIYADEIATVVEGIHLEDLVVESKGRAGWSPQLVETAKNMALSSSLGFGIARSDASTWELPHAHNVAKKMDKTHANPTTAAAIKELGFELGVALGLRINLGNRQMSRLPLGESYKRTLEVLPFKQPGMLEVVINHTLAQYEEGLEAMRHGRVKGIVTQDYLDKVAQTFAHIGTRSLTQEQVHALPQRPDGTVPLAGLSPQQYKLQMLILGHNRLLAQGTSLTKNPYLEIGRAFELPNGAALDISKLVKPSLDSKPRSEKVSLNAGLDKVAALKAEIREHPRLGTSAMVSTAVAASLALGVTTAAATPNTSPSATTRSTVAQVQTFAPMISTVGSTPTSVNANVMPVTAAPVNLADRAALTPNQQGKIGVKTETAAPKPIDPKDVIAVAELAMQEGSTEAAAKAIEEQAPAEVPLGNKPLSDAMKRNANKLIQDLEGERGANLSRETKEQIKIYAMYIELAADNPAVLKKAEAWRMPLTEGKAFGRPEVVEAILPGALDFFATDIYDNNALTPEDKEMLAALWANAHAQLMTDKEIEALPKPPQDYDEKGGDGFGENAPKAPDDKAETGILNVAKVKDSLEQDNSELSKKKLKFLQDVTISAMSAKANGSKINVEVLVAQAVHESGWGQSGLAEKANNLFGVKAGDSWKGKRISMKTGEVFNGNSVTVDASWRAYDSIEDAITDYIKMVTNQDNFADAIKCSDNADSYIDGLLAKLDPETCKIAIPQGEQGAMSYATDPEYKNKILRTITSLGLDKFANSKPFVVKKSPEPAPKAPEKSESKEVDKTVKPMSEKAKAELDAFLNSVTRKGSQLTSGYTNKGIEDTESRGLKNGRFPDSELVQVTKHGHRLQKAAAESYFAMDEAFNTDHPGKHLNFGTILTAYRTYAEQEDLKKRKGKWAADPGTSNHGMGRAGDFSDMGAGSLRDEWMKANAWKFGWFKPEGLGPNSAKGTYEPWHYEYVLINWED